MARGSAALAVLGAVGLALGGCADEAPPVTAAPVFAVAGLDAVVQAVALAPDGGVLAVGDMDGRVTLHEVPSGVVRWTSPAAAGRIDAIAFSADGALLGASGEGARTVAVWDTASGREVGAVAVRDARALAFHPADRALVVAARATVHVADVATAEVTRALPNAHQGEPVYAIAFSADGRVLATASAQGALKLWSWPALTLRASVTVAPAPETLAPVSLAVSRDGTRAALGGLLGRVHVLDGARERELRTFANAPEAPGHDRHAEMRHALAFTGDSEWLFAPDLHDRGLRVVHVASGRSHAVIRGAAPFDQAAAIAVPAGLVALLHPADGSGRGPYGLEVWRLTSGAK